MSTPQDERPSDREKSEYRLLYVGQDVDWFRRLRRVLKLPANRLVYCAGGSSVGHFMKSNIRYDLFWFDLDLLDETGLELVRLVRSLPHRHLTPIIMAGGDEVIGRLEDLARQAGANECLTKAGDILAAVEAIERFLGQGSNCRC
jgi:PleD family two-component response regulator